MEPHTCDEHGHPRPPSERRPAVHESMEAHHHEQQQPGEADEEVASVDRPDGPDGVPRGPRLTDGGGDREHPGQQEHGQQGSFPFPDGDQHEHDHDDRQRRGRDLAEPGLGPSEPAPERLGLRDPRTSEPPEDRAVLVCGRRGRNGGLHTAEAKQVLPVPPQGEAGDGGAAQESRHRCPRFDTRHPDGPAVGGHDRDRHEEREALGQHRGEQDRADPRRRRTARVASVHPREQQHEERGQDEQQAVVARH